MNCWEYLAGLSHISEAKCKEGSDEDGATVQAKEVKEELEEGKWSVQQLRQQLEKPPIAGCADTPAAAVRIHDSCFLSRFCRSTLATPITCLPRLMYVGTVTPLNGSSTPIPTIPGPRACDTNQ